MKTYIVDWGKMAKGGRYALIQAKSLTAAWIDADAVGAPFKIMELKIPMGEPECGGRYMEIDAPEEVFEGVTLEGLPWDTAE